MCYGGGLGEEKEEVSGVGEGKREGGEGAECGVLWGDVSGVTRR